MKRVSEVASELNVSRQTVYNRVYKTLTKELTGHIHIDKQGKKVIDARGVTIIKKSLLVKQPVKQSVKRLQPIDKDFTQPIDKEIKDILVDQLQEKDKQINELLRQNQSLIDKVENMQHLLNNTQQENQLLIAATSPQEAPQEEKGLIKRWFSRK